MTVTHSQMVEAEHDWCNAVKIKDPSLDEWVEIGTAENVEGLRVSELDNISIGKEIKEVDFQNGVEMKITPSYDNYDNCSNHLFLNHSYDGTVEWVTGPRSESNKPPHKRRWYMFNGKLKEDIQNLKDRLARSKEDASQWKESYWRQVGFCKQAKGEFQGMETERQAMIVDMLEVERIVIKNAVRGFFKEHEFELTVEQYEELDGILE